MKVILTGATGLVGEGVLFECLKHPQVTEILIISRHPYEGPPSPKLKECVVKDFFHLDDAMEQMKGYDACFYCAGVSSRGMSEGSYMYFTYDTAMNFANIVLMLNPDIIFAHISGSLTDSSEKGKIMWARIKGKTENALMRLPFKRIYNFRPGFMKPTTGQRNATLYYKFIGSLYPLLYRLFPNMITKMSELGQAMINSALKGYSKPILEINDIKQLAKA